MRESWSCWANDSQCFQRVNQPSCPFLPGQGPIFSQKKCTLFYKIVSTAIRRRPSGFYQGAAGARTSLGFSCSEFALLTDMLSTTNRLTQNPAKVLNYIGKQGLAAHRPATPVWIQDLTEIPQKFGCPNSHQAMRARLCGGLLMLLRKLFAPVVSPMLLIPLTRLA